MAWAIQKLPATTRQVPPSGAVESVVLMLPNRKTVPCERCGAKSELSERIEPHRSFEQARELREAISHGRVRR